MNKILLGMALLSVSLPTVRLDAQEPTLVLARIPYDRDTFDAMEIIRPVDASEPPFRVGQTIHVWNGSSSSAHEVEVDAIREEAFDQWFSKLVLAYHPTLEREERDSGSHLCPRPGFDPSYGGPVDPRGHTYQLASASAFPEQSWRCSELTPSEVEEVSEATGLPIGTSVGFTKIIRGSGAALYQAADMIYPCRVVFLEEEEGELAVVKESSECNLEPFVDVDGDGVPEFLAPFADSPDAWLRRLWPTEEDLAAYETGR